MKIFIDLGAFDGDTLAKAMMLMATKADKYIGFEPYPESFNKAVERFKNHTNVKLYNVAASTKAGVVDFYLHKEGLNEGNSLFKDKPNINPRNSIQVLAIDIANFISSNCFKDDVITLKVDVEGKEYDIFEHLIETGVIQYISKIYCEWHWTKVGVSRERHDKVVSQLKELGFNVTGNSSVDEFIYA